MRKSGTGKRKTKIRKKSKEGTRQNGRARDMGNG